MKKNEASQSISDPLPKKPFTIMLDEFEIAVLASAGMYDKDGPDGGEFTCLYLVEHADEIAADMRGTFEEVRRLRSERKN